MKIAVTLLVENTARGQGVLGEHGLSWWIEAGAKRVLFDTGQGMALQKNATKFGFDFQTIDAIVLSHGHYDHVGGLECVLKENRECPVWLHPAALEKKYSCPSGRPAREISIPFLHEKKMGEAASRLRYSVNSEEIVPQIFLTGEIPRRRSFEDVGGPFFLDETGKIPDPLSDDQAVYFESSRGVVVVLGCAHAGVLNTLEKITEKTKKPIFSILGGMHLESATESRMEKTIAGLKEFGVKEIYPCHCSGQNAFLALHKELPGCVHSCAVGSRWEFFSVE